MEVLITIILLISVLFILTIISIWEDSIHRKKVQRRIRSMYGQPPQNDTPKYEQIKLYWNEKKECIGNPEKIDDVTWNDLEMDKIFEGMNSTSSFAGEQVLYAQLHYISQDKTQLNDLEKEMMWFDHHQTERESMQYHLWELGKNKINYYIPLFMNQLDLQKFPYLLFCRILQITFAIAIAAMIMMPGAVSRMVVIGHFVFNIVVYSLFKSRYELFLNSLLGIARIVKFMKGVKGKYPSEFVSEQILEDIRILSRITRMIGVLGLKKKAVLSGDLLGVFQDYLIGATLWDFTQYDKVIRNLEGKREEFMRLYEFTGRMDMLISIASYRHSLSEYCIPEFDAGKGLFMKNIYHPLVSNPVKNTLHMKRNIILTGSNASGKSTFIKALALNAILAQSIHTCMAERVQMPDMNVLTTMSLRDDVISGESYFIKEVRYLKRIIDASSEARMALCVIDEILRGTNTKERIAASTAVIRHLNHANCLVLVATHDMELTEQFPDVCDMFHFSEKLADHDVQFDYLLKEGKSCSSNAIKLLEHTGFPSDIVKEAFSLAER